MPFYRVKPGYTYGAYDQWGPGAIVELDERAYQSFSDKLEPVDVADAGNGADVPPVPLPEVGTLPPRQGMTLPAAPIGAPQVGAEPATSEAPFDVASATVNEVLAAVRDGKIGLEEAVAQEKAGKNRTTLLAALEGMASGGED